MGKLMGAFIFILIVILDVIAGILGIQAELAQNKVRHIKYLIFECREPSHEAFRLGLAAAGLLVLAHVIANLLGGCVCICSKYELERSTANRQLAAACSILSWVLLVVAFAMLIIGAMANSKSRTSCGFSHHNFLAIGGILCFVHALFCVAYYVSATATVGEEEKAHRRGSSQMTERGEHGGHH